jgi:uncharacterized RDD family membrane protein YckC
MQRYVHHLGLKVDALGGTASTVYPNPDGSGRPYDPHKDQPGEPLFGERLLIRILVVLFLFLALFAFVTAAIIAGTGGGVLEVLISVLVGTALAVAAVYLWSRPRG